MLSFCGCNLQLLCDHGERWSGNETVGLGMRLKSLGMRLGVGNEAEEFGNETVGFGNEAEEFGSETVGFGNETVGFTASVLLSDCSALFCAGPLSQAG